MVKRTATAILLLLTFPLVGCHTFWHDRQVAQSVAFFRQSNGREPDELEMKMIENVVTISENGSGQYVVTRYGYYRQR